MRVKSNKAARYRLGFSRRIVEVSSELIMVEVDTWEVLNDVGIFNAAYLFLVWPMLRTSLQLAFKLMRESAYK